MNEKVEKEHMALLEAHKSVVYIYTRPKSWVTVLVVDQIEE